MADYQASLSGTRTAVFTYTVVAADRDDNGIFLWGHGSGNTSFVLDSNDTIQNSANADAVLDYPRHRTQSGHKVDGSLTPPISVPYFPDADNDNTADPIALNIDENSAAGTSAGTVVATDTDGDPLTYTVSGDDNLIFARTFDYDTATGAITVKTGASLDHEVKASYSISVAVTDGETTLGVAETGTPTTDDMVTVTITVTDVAETEIVALSYPDPWAGVVLIAGLDGDEVTALTWSWQRSQDGSTGWGTPDGTAVSGNNYTTSYTPTAADVGYFIRATASYMENSVAATATAKTTAVVIAKPACDSPANILGAALGGIGYPADIWSDGRTIWVSMKQNNGVNPELAHPILPFNLCDGTRLSTVPPFYLGNNAENEELRSMWAEGPTMWALRDENDTPLYAYSMHPTRGWLPDSTMRYTFSGSLGSNTVHDVWVVDGIMYAGRSGWRNPSDYAMVLAYNWTGRPAAGGALSQLTDRDYQNSDHPNGAIEYTGFVILASDDNFLWLEIAFFSPRPLGALKLGTSGAPVRTTAKDIPIGSVTDRHYGLWSDGRRIWRAVGNHSGYSATTGVYPTTIPNVGPYFPDTDSDDTADPVAFTLAENALADAELGTVTATDPEDDTITYSVGGADATAFAEAFTLNTVDGKITVKTGSNLSFETKPSYSITIEATDGKDADGDDEVTATVDSMVAVTITVTDVEEDGSISLSRATPAVGIAITATLTDPDGGETAITWQWSKSDTEMGTFADIDSATAASYTPVTADVGKWLKVTASYTDRRGSGKTATKTADNAVDTTPFKVPAFADETITFTVAENAPGETVVGTVLATDADGDTLHYSVDATGADYTAFIGAFRITIFTGIITVRPITNLDYETKASYSIIVQVTDEEDASGTLQNPPATDDTITVTINVTNVDEAGTVTLSPKDPRVYVEQTASVTDIDGAVTELTWQWSKSDTADGTFTNIASATSAAYTPLPADFEKFLKAKASYTDPQGSGKTAELITSNAVGESPHTSPAFANEAEILTVAENTAPNTIVGTIAAVDEDGDTLKYFVAGTDHVSFLFALDFEPSTGEITVKDGTYLDYETKSSYSITVGVSDSENPDGTHQDNPSIDHSVEVTVNVTDLEEEGVVTLPPTTPVTGTPFNATLSDPDGGETSITWQWSKSATESGNFTNISGATNPSYTPVDADLNAYLKVTASYTDRRGSGKSADATAGNTVIDSPYKVPQFAAETQEVSVDENTAPGLAVVSIQANDPDGDEPRYSLGGTDASAFNQVFLLSEVNGLIKVKLGATVDYESKSSYSITVNVTDGEDANGNAENPPLIDDSIDVTINVNDLEEEGVVTIPEDAPVTGTPFTATLSDPDGGETSITWQWSKSATESGNFTNISGATNPSYTPVDADLNAYLKVTASYTDRRGSGKSADATAGNTVIDSTILVVSHTRNDSC